MKILNFASKLRKEFIAYILSNRVIVDNTFEYYLKIKYSDFIDIFHFEDYNIIFINLFLSFMQEENIIQDFEMFDNYVIISYYIE
jgi:hypothetical protein